ncbi:acyl-CoA thioesterase [Anaeromyxobacter oryzisoli]|uniref:acyl-CoA thioesterase n=1 Tax=Anaeromyxobacter oryzisoli TaxID=2925408 RepID=UPI001F57CD79|nr:acyl-CoA thioesterase [Anaeromyxobacter sp. SG63]
MTRPLDTSRQHTLPLGSDPALRRRFMVMDVPLQGNLRFGLLLEVLDKLAEETALDYVRRHHPAARVVTAAIDNVIVRAAADVTRDLVFLARINYVGRTSMEVGIRIEQAGAPPVHVASCYFTMVARSIHEERSLPVPPLEVVDERERHRAEKAIHKREVLRIAEAAAHEPPTREEFDELAALHEAQQAPDFEGKLARNFVTDSWERMYPEQENVPRKIFGGYLIRRAYELCSISAYRIAPDRPIIAAVNRINFFHPVRLGDMLHYTSRIVYSGHCAVSVQASIERISRDRTAKALSNSCLFTFVNVDDALVPQPVPVIHPTTFAEDARYLDAVRKNRALGVHPLTGVVLA